MQRILLVAGVYLSIAVGQLGAQISVTSSGDSGPGTLRQAITTANASTGADTIVFKIPGPAQGQHRITLTTSLPAITSPVSIDGFTQDGATPNTSASGYNAVLKVELRGQGASGNVDGLQINAPNSTVRGLVINGFIAGVTFNGTNGRLEGCMVGTDVAGSGAVPNGDGVRVTTNASGAIIGGTSPDVRNVISGNLASGIALAGNGAFVQGNRIGTDAAGNAAIPNLDGLATVGASFAPILSATIGGGAAGAGNLISGNARNGVYLTSTSSGFIVRGNRIGTAADGTSPLGNAANGIALATSNHNNTNIGGTAAGEGNLIAFNGRDGVALLTGTGTRVAGNSIHSNGSTPGDLGIDLGPDGITPNDPNDTDSGPNNLQNFPVIATTSFANGQVQISGTLSSASGTSYRLEFFATGQPNAVDPLQGRTFLGAGTVTTNANGNAVFNLSFAAPASPGLVTATAIDPNGNTSEFAVPLPVITSPLGVRVTIGQPFYYLVKATSNPSGYSVGDLPAGLFYDSFLDAILGTPTQTSGSTPFQVPVSASNESGTRTETLNLMVQSVSSSGLTITSSYSSSGRVGQPFEFQVITTGGSGATRISASNLPPGLTIDEMTGVISGTPTADGSFSVQLTATNGNSSTSETLQLTFISDPAVPVIVSPTSLVISEGQSVQYTISAPASPPPGDATEFTLLGQLPDGLGFDQSAGQIVGTYTPQTSARTAARGKPLTGGVITNVQLFATNSQGTSTVPLIFFLAPKGVVNISTRLAIGTDQNVLIAGFIVTGNAPKKLIIRAIAPSLGIGGALQDPTLELREGDNLLGSNDDWRSNQEQDIIATTIPPTDNRESALVAILQPGAYTAVIAGKNGSTGIGLAEVYDLGTASLESTSDSKLANISTRGFVQTNDDVMIGGFIVSGAPTSVIIRAVGPSLANRGVAGSLDDTTLDFFDGNGSLIVANDDWRTGGQEQQIINTTVPPDDDRESAVVATINPGGYTAVIRGKDGRTGVALVEVYVLP